MFALCRFGLGLLAAAALVFAKEPTDISVDLAKIIQETPVPALAAAAVWDGQIVAAGAAGVRKAGDDTPVTVHDQFHIGSCTKSMTGTLAAMLVADGKIQWSTTVAEVFPDLEIDGGYRSATLLQFCSNTSGAPGDIPPAVWQAAVAARDQPEAVQRLALVRAVLTAPPTHPPGSSREYSNAGFTIAGAMLEKVSGQSYGDLLRERLFRPLNMGSAGFGAAAVAGPVTQPYGHFLDGGKPVAVPPGLDADNPAAITPAGRVHLSIQDFAQYANFHLGVGEIRPLNDAALNFLHTPVPPGDDYAVGWVPLERSWAGGTALYHNGTNTMNFAVIWLAPNRKFGVVVATNLGGPAGAKACDAAASMLIRKFLPE